MGEIDGYCFQITDGKKRLEVDVGGWVDVQWFVNFRYCGCFIDDNLPEGLRVAMLRNCTNQFGRALVFGIDGKLESEDLDVIVAR